MFRRFSVKHIALVCVALMLMLSSAWAIQTYYNSVTIKKQKGFAQFQIIGWEVFGEVRWGALDAYMNEQGVTSVKITVEATEELVQRDDGTSYYRLSFVFGPTGCYFDPPLELNIDGKYVAPDTEVRLYDANGELIPGERSFLYDDQMTFYIPHFSYYSYDQYY